MVTCTTGFFRLPVEACGAPWAVFTAAQTDVAPGSCPDPPPERPTAKQCKLSRLSLPCHSAPLESDHQPSALSASGSFNTTLKTHHRPYTEYSLEINLRYLAEYLLHQATHILCITGGLARSIVLDLVLDLYSV